MDLSDPLIARLAVPVAVTVIVSVLIRLIGGSGTRAAGVGLPAGAIAAYAVSPGWPIDPPTAPLAQVAWLMVAGALAGLVLDIAAKGRALTAVVAFLWPAVTLAVFLGFVLPAMGSATMIQVAEVAVVLGALLAWLHTIRDQGLSSPVTLGVISLGLGVLAFVSGLGNAAAFGFSLAAAGLGWLICNSPNKRLLFGSAALIGWGGAASGLAAHLALNTDINALLVLLVVLAVVVELVARSFVAGNSLVRGEALAPLALAILIAIPGAIAVALQVYAPGVIPRIW